MLSRKDFLPLNFVKKEDFTGSYKGIRFMLRNETVEDEKKLRVYVWSEPLGFEATPDSEKISEIFEFNDEGLEHAIEWINGKYEDVRRKEE